MLLFLFNYKNKFSSQLFILNCFMSSVNGVLFQIGWYVSLFVIIFLI